MDKKYWEDYYLKQRSNTSSTTTLPQTPSMFCHFIVNELSKHVQKPWCILDAGCGNGRDTTALAKHAMHITGVDSCGFLPTEDTQLPIHFETADFTNCNKDAYNIIYSRFTFHSINDEQQEAFLGSIHKKGTLLCMETRSDKSKDEARITGDTHYRNFTNMNRLKQQLKTHHFEILYICEEKNVAVHKGENPICIRVIGVKQ